ncbi:MAG TPA: copper chaperone PCu(A)C, partial [Ramlibacter sp.]|nr:copper chaperone PCu(A)C [Ramlibacter sp.]
MTTWKLSLAAIFVLVTAWVDAAPTSSSSPDASVRTLPGQLPKVEGAWVRTAVPGQQGTGAFMRLTARQPMQLIGVTTPVAGTAEVHEMKQEGDIMRMRQVAKVELPAGQTVEFKPGGYHVMLMDLKQALKPGTVVPLTLVLRDARGAEHRLELNATVAAQAPAALP